jgi:alkanesulfonate monooxygenase SsuD/methylene tetrahydromethanopterin reductase-like flavin-dependent oxidoreductase (luciferase family)
MRFGMFVPQGWLLDLAEIETSDHWTVMRDVAQSADAGPWESIWVYDHFHTAPIPTAEATHEAWSLMAAFAASTSRVRLGQMCTCIGYRNPAYLAKVAATVDVISGGRVEMGTMLEEGVRIMRQA